MRWSTVEGLIEVVDGFGVLAGLVESDGQLDANFAFTGRCAAADHSQQGLAMETQRLSNMAETSVSGAEIACSVTL